MSVGVRVATTKRIVFVLAAAGAAIAGSLWLATAISFQPKTFFSVQWTSYMIFMVLVGGLGTFEGSIIGAIIFFLIEATFGGAGVWHRRERRCATSWPAADPGARMTRLCSAMATASGNWPLYSPAMTMNAVMTCVRLSPSSGARRACGGS